MLETTTPVDSRATSSELSPADTQSPFGSSPPYKRSTGWYFGFFFVSGFCSILYEIIWLRLAMAQFGVTTALVSIVLSMFMAGLGLGSWAVGKLMNRRGTRLKFSGLRLYALAELLIAVASVTVPRQLLWGRELLSHLESGLSLSSWNYYLVAGLWIALTLVPWCACMGATFPFAMSAIREESWNDAGRSFSYLYLANVLGAVTGAVVPLFLIELMGFNGALRVGSALNLVLAASALTLSLNRAPAAKHTDADNVSSRPSGSFPAATGQRKLLWLLFATGLTSMGMEVVWIRLFTPSLGTVVYAFAAILGLYLGATYLGSKIYRKWSRQARNDTDPLWLVLGVLSLIPLLTADPGAPIPPLLRVVIGITPFTGLLGFVTPMLVDRLSSGDPNKAGTAYAINVAGCICGPLLAGFVLLPWLGERLSICTLALPWFVIGFLFEYATVRRGTIAYVIRMRAVPYVLTAASVMLVLLTKGYEEQFSRRDVRRDHTATAIATGESREDKRLLINGVGITQLSPITKMMAHLPLAFLGRQPQNALVICFGMGTTYRSMLSWGIPSTAVELVPSVPSLFYYFHSDGPRLLQSPLSHVVIDDGRLYLERSKEQYDVVTIDPPPPVEAAGSSLLYSKDFYEIVKRKLRPGGILQQWLPKGDSALRASVARAVKESFPYVRVFSSVEGTGLHFLASTAPILGTAASELALRLPERASSDLIEWGPASTPEQQFAILLKSEIPVDQIIREDPKIPALQDDRPINEYFLLRRMRDQAYIGRLWRRFLTRELSPPLGVKELLAYSLVRRSS